MGSFFLKKIPNFLFIKFEIKIIQYIYCRQSRAEFKY